MTLASCCSGRPSPSLSRRESRSSAGFTLLELVIAIALIGVIVLIVSGAMRLALRSIDSGERRIDSLERFRTSMNIISAQIQSEVPLTRDDNGEKKFYFEGNSDAMQFSTSYSIWSGQQGFVVVNYKVKSVENGKNSLMASESVIGTENARDAILFNNVDELSFEYYYQDPTEEKGSWTEHWTDDTTTPTKVRIHLKEGKKDLALIVPMRTPGVLTKTQATQGFTPVRPAR